MQPQITPPEILSETVALLEAMCALSSPTGDREGMAAAMAHYRRALEDVGLRVDTILEAGDARGQPMLLARPAGIPGPLQSAKRGADLVVIGHLDTVLPARSPSIEGDRLLATGSADMKGGMATLVGALRLLATQDKRPPGDLLVVVVPDEEILGPYTQHAVEAFGGNARALWSLEPGKRRGDRETVVIGRRGLYNWRLASRGRGAHAGGAYWQGRSALVAAADWCRQAAALSRPDAGPTINPARMIAADQDFADAPSSDPALFGSSRQLNVVPDRAIVEGEARFLAPKDGPALLAALERITQEIAARCEVEMTFAVTKRVAPMSADGRSRAVAERYGALAARHGVGLEVEDARGGLSFPNMLPSGAATIAIDGLGPAGGGLHTRDEWVDLVSLDRRITLLADLLASEAEYEEGPGGAPS